MRTIDKHAEPACLAELRREARRIATETKRPAKGDDWNPEHCAGSIRESLHDEQGGLCAYCNGRIKPHGYRSEFHPRGGMKIEHWDERSIHPARMYDWENLLGVCGGEYRGSDGLVEHCDTSRKENDERLHVNPGTRTPPRPEDVFAFKSTPPDPSAGPARQGVWIHAVDPQGASDIDTLNLNADHLVRNRHSAIEELRLALGRLGRNRNKGETTIRELLRRRLATATTPGPRGLPPFAPLIADYVRKKMRAKGMGPS
jgi:uncharacterized protein (TIGR02646 family)